MLKAFAIIIAIFIAVVHVSAQPNGSAKRGFGALLLKRPAVVRVGPSTTFMKPGLSTAQVVRLLGEPLNQSDRSNNGVRVVTYEFVRSENRVFIAEFVNDALVSSRTESRTQIAHTGF